jgi:hypothetical protein
MQSGKIIADYNSSLVEHEIIDEWKRKCATKGIKFRERLLQLIKGDLENANQ